jgi:CRISPR-associated endoribonuclease Cas6
MSFFKFALVKEYQAEFNNYYNKPKIKPFSFSVYTKDLKHEKSYIISPSKELKMVFSSNDYNFINMIYNSLLINKKRKMSVAPNNKVFLKRLSLIYLEEIEKEQITIKMLSPLLIRDRDKKLNKDYYKTVEDKDFLEKLNFNLNYLANSFKLDTNNLYIEPLDVKKVVVPIMSVRYDANDGIFTLRGKAETLNTLYKIGIGSRRGEGFGLFEIVND